MTIKDMPAALVRIREGKNDPADSEKPAGSDAMLCPCVGKRRVLLFSVFRNIFQAAFQNITQSVQRVGADIFIFAQSV